MSVSTASRSASSGYNVYEPTCPARAVLEHLTSRWGVLALGALQERTYRFSELRRRIGGVSEKMLTQTLRTLERAAGSYARRTRKSHPTSSTA